MTMNTVSQPAVKSAVKSVVRVRQYSFNNRIHFFTWSDSVSGDTLSDIFSVSDLQDLPSYISELTDMGCLDLANKVISFDMVYNGRLAS